MVSDGSCFLVATDDPWHQLYVLVNPLAGGPAGRCISSSSALISMAWHDTKIPKYVCRAARLLGLRSVESLPFRN